MVSVDVKYHVYLLACLLAYLLTYLPTYLPTYLQYDRLITRCCPCSCACLTETEGAAPSSGVVDQSQTAVRGRRPAADADDQQGPGPGNVHDSLPWRHFRHASGLGGPRQGLLRQLRSRHPPSLLSGSWGEGGHTGWGPRRVPIEWGWHSRRSPRAGHLRQCGLRRRTAAKHALVVCSVADRVLDAHRYTE